MTAEKKVGFLFLITLVVVVLFGAFLTSYNPFVNEYNLDLAYNYAGGIEVGSPVRAMGIKVGRVKNISFEPGLKVGDEETHLRVSISIKRDAWSSLRTDSRFYINLAGVIGEKFIEVSPGTSTADPIKPGALLRGEDPPRIDQLISQSYGLAGKVIEFINKNEGSAVSTIDSINRLMGNLERLMKQLDKTSQNKDVGRLVNNMITISDDMAYFTQKMRSEDGEKTIKLINRLLWRLDDLDAPTIRKFLQQEGIKAKIF